MYQGSGEYVEVLTAGNVECVSLANDHTLDYGEKGYLGTKGLLEDSGVDSCEHQESKLIYTKNGLAVGLYAHDVNRGNPKEEKLEEAFQLLRESGAEVIVFAVNWGREGKYRAANAQIQIGHMAIDAGADLVWGYHPHVLQPVEEYGDGIIFYSTGSLVYGGNPNPKDLDTAILQVEVIRETDGTVRLEQWTAIPCSVSSVVEGNDYQPTPYAEDAAEYATVMQKLNGTF